MKSISELLTGKESNMYSFSDGNGSTKRMDVVNLKIKHERINFSNRKTRRTIKNAISLAISLILCQSTWLFGQTPNTWTQKADFTYDSPNVATPEPRINAVSFSIGSKGYIGTGSDANSTLRKDFWEYDPHKNTWTQKADFGGPARMGAVGFNIGRKGYAGTGTDNNTIYKDFWEYDPKANAWMQKADFEGEARNDATGFGIDGKGYVGTGHNNITSMKDFWEYDPVSDHWTQKADFGGNARFGSVSFCINHHGYLGTGLETILGPKKDLWEYNPETDTWIQKADFGGTGRYAAVGFTIGEKGFIGTGNIGSGSGAKDFWEYDPILNSWTKKADFAGGDRTYASGFSIGDKGYIGTGYFIIYAKDFWEYDPYSNVWTEKEQFGHRTRSVAIGFSIGNKGYIGLGRDHITDKKDFWEYDPAFDGWTQKADFGGGYLGWGTGFSVGGKGYIGTGFYSVQTDPTNDFWEYDPSANTWTQKKDFGGIPRYRAVGFSVGNKGYISCGVQETYDEALFFKDLWEYDPTLDTWTKKADFGGSPRENAVAFAIDGKAYLGTGKLFNYDIGQWIYFSDFWEYNPETNSWAQKANFKGSPRSAAVGLSIRSKGYIGTGNNEFNLYKDFWEYDPSTNDWVQKTDFAGNARVYAAGFSINSRGYIGTGLESFSEATESNDFWEYTPDEVTLACSAPTNLLTVNVTSNTATISWESVGGVAGYQVAYLTAGPSEATVARSSTNAIVLSELFPDTEYALKVASICSISPLLTSEPSLPIKFITSPLRLTGDVQPSLEVFPNPFSNSAIISFSLSNESYSTIELFDLTGRKLETILDKNLPAGNHEVILNRGNLGEGIYLIEIMVNGESEIKKLIIE